MRSELPELLGETYASLAERACAFAQRELAGLEEEPQDAAAEDALARQSLSKLAREGLLAYAVPAAETTQHPATATALVAGANGGAASTPDVRSIAILRETLAYWSGMADLAFVMQGLGSFPIALAGSPELKGRWLAAVAGGEAIAALAITEPEAGSDLASIRLEARKDGGDYLLDGVKTLISNAPIADLVTVIARTGPGEGSKGLSGFAIPGRHAGLDRSERLRLIAAHPIGVLRFSGCRVPASWRIGGEGDGARIALATLSRFRPTVGAAAVGFASRAFDEARRRAKERVQFGRPLAEFGAIQCKLAEMATLIDAARLLVYRAAAALDAGERGARESSMAKLFATEAASQVADEAVQIFGGLGVVRGTAVERIYREVRALRIYEGTSEIQRSIIAREIVEGPESE